MSALLHQPAVLLFTFVLIILFPLADAFVYARLQTVLHVYLWNILALWTLTLIAIALLCRDGFTLPQFGQNLGVYPRNILTSSASSSSSSRSSFSTNTKSAK